MRLRNLIGGIALSLFSMLATQTAFAGTCASPVDSDGQNVTINVTGDCNITTPINVPGTVNITVANGNLTMSQPVTSNGPVNVTVSGGYISEQAVTSNQDLITLKADSITGTSLTAYGIQTTSTVGSTKFTGTLQTVAGNMLLVAQTSLATGNLVETIGYMDLKAYAGGTGVTPFVIGGSGNSNGINGTVKATGGSFGNDGIMVVNGVFTQTGVSSSVGDITIASASAFNLATPSGSGATFGINLNANSGTITLPAGEINMDASGGNGNAGYIALEAATISAPSGSILSSNQAASETVGRTIWIGASNINFGGSSGLTVRANGGYGSVNFYPTGGLNFSDSEDVSNLAWGIGPNNAAGSIAFNGSGSPLVIAANGNNGQVNINAYPLTFASSSLSITANGNESSFIGLGVGDNTKTGNSGIAFNVSGATTIDASAAASQNGGNVTIWEDQVSINGTTFAIKANGPSSGNGNGGTLSLLWSNTILNSATKASFSASGASATTGIGNGGSITYWPGAPTLAFGSAVDQLSITARGGKSSGNGGKISVSGNTMSFNGTQATAMDVSAPGTTGDGGTLSVNGGTITFSGTGYTLAANAGSTQGNGGTVSLSAFAALKVGNSAGGVQFSAKGAGTGNGGTVTVSGLPLTIAAASVNVSAGTGTGSNATGGNINITSNFGGTITGNFAANGLGAGTGGIITIKTDTATFTGATFTANGGVSGNGGSISLTTTGSNAVSISGSTKFTASGGSTTGSGGTLSFTTASNLTLASSSVIASATGSGNGGSISATVGAANTLTVTGSLDVSAGNGSNSEGNGGTINFHDNGTLAVDSAATFKAIGEGNGTGGSITLDSQNRLVLLLNSLNASGGQTGPGGKIVVTNADVSPTYAEAIVQAWAGTGFSGTGIFGGSVKLNGVTCQQYFTGLIWPTFYRNCVNPTSPTSTDQIPPTTAGGLSAQLSAVKLVMYVMSDASQYQTFYGEDLSETDITGGITEPQTSAPIMVSAIFENTSRPLINGTESALPGSLLIEVSLHEMAHVIDWNAGLANSSGSAPYQTNYADDYQYLNQAGGGKPCLADGTGPFNGVVDIQTGAQFCNGATLNNPATKNNPNGIYTGLNNSGIAQASTGNLSMHTVQLGTAYGYIEPFAQSFAYQDYGKTLSYPSGYADTTADGLFRKGYYKCIQTYAANLAGVSYTPVFSYSCN